MKTNSLTFFLNDQIAKKTFPEETLDLFGFLNLIHFWRSIFGLTLSEMLLNFHFKTIHCKISLSWTILAHVFCTK